MDFARLESDDVNAYYDVPQRIVFIVYGENVTQELTAQVYAWASTTFTSADIAESRGSIYDFSKVKRFSLGNLPTVQQKSRDLNRKDDLSHHAVGLIVENFYQESMVKTAMQVTPGQERKRIVYSMEEALAFIHQFHAKRNHPSGGNINSHTIFLQEKV